MDEEEFGLDSTFGDDTVSSNVTPSPVITTTAPLASAPATVASAPSVTTEVKSPSSAQYSGISSPVPVNSAVAPSTVPVDDKKVSAPEQLPPSIPTNEAVSAEEARRFARAAKFGIPVKPVVTEAPKKDKKQQQENKKSADAGDKADPAKLEARAARFNITAVAAAGVPAESAELLEKKRLRAERFGIGLKLVSAPVAKAPSAGEGVKGGNKKNKKGSKATVKTPPGPVAVDEEMVYVFII